MLFKLHLNELPANLHSHSLSVSELEYSLFVASLLVVAGPCAGIGSYSAHCRVLIAMQSPNLRPGGITASHLPKSLRNEISQYKTGGNWVWCPKVSMVVLIGAEVLSENTGNTDMHLMFGIQHANRFWNSPLFAWQSIW